ncbi:MAG: ATPase [Saprospiraceae bacterium]
MSRIIADAGSTKIDWVLIDLNGIQHTIQTVGFNPNQQDISYFERILSELSAAIPVKDQLLSIRYFGTGCGTFENRQLIATKLSEHFKIAQVEVDTDLFAAALALCQGEEGIACVLGTGSNSCHFSGKEILSQVPNLGFILGDEGSGSWIGKEIVKAYFYEKLSPQINQAISKRLPGGRDELLATIQANVGLNSWFAEFCTVLSEFPEDEKLQNIVRMAFTEFVETHIQPYAKAQIIPIHFAGSLAFHFQAKLREIVESRGMTMGRVLQRPIDGLILFDQMNIES